MLHSQTHELVRYFPKLHIANRAFSSKHGLVEEYKV